MDVDGSVVGVVDDEEPVVVGTDVVSKGDSVEVGTKTWVVLVGVVVVVVGLVLVVVLVVVVVVVVVEVEVVVVVVGVVVVVVQRSSKHASTDPL